MISSRSKLKYISITSKVIETMKLFILFVLIITVNSTTEQGSAIKFRLNPTQLVIRPPTDLEKIKQQLLGPTESCEPNYFGDFFLNRKGDLLKCVRSEKYAVYPRSYCEGLWKELKKTSFFVTSYHKSLRGLCVLPTYKLVVIEEGYGKSSHLRTFLTKMLKSNTKH